MRSIVVFKLGGSLLDLPDLASRVRELFSLRSDHSPLLVVGGGKAADLVRQWQQVHRLTDEQAHWLAIDAMGLNEDLLQELLPELRLVRSLPQFEAACRDRVPSLLCASCFLRWGESQGFEPLPRSWDITSDSIAAWVAGIVSADELILIKSQSLRRGQTADQAASEGVVDRQFPHLGARLTPVSWAYGRADMLEIQPWLPATIRSGLNSSR